jgi:tetratricopeptide (TPR) repeat protein
VPKLVIFRGDAVEQEVRLTGSPVRIGRHARNEIVLDDGLNGVSRFHAEIRAEGGTYYIVDTNSRNGVWINGRRIKDKAALALGMPATVGGFELALEDDVSTGEFDEPFAGQPTMVSVPSADRKEAPSRPAARSRPPKSPLSASQRQMLLWSAVGAATLLICLVTFVVVRNRTRPVTTVVENVPPPVAAPQPEPPPPPVEDPKKAAIDQHLADARAQIGTGDYAGAIRDHLQIVLELDPDNADALQLKKEADETIAAAAQAQRTRPPAAKPEQPQEPETAGIQRRPNELYADYTTRVKRIQVNFSEGKNYLDKQEFPLALARFRLVERDQPKYQGVDQVIADALARQQKLLEDAISSGQQNEVAGKIKEARQWYVHALEIDPGSTSAREKNAALLNRQNLDANKLYDKANYAFKLGDTATGMGQLQQILNLMLPGDEIREKAQKQLEALKK